MRNIVEVSGVSVRDGRRQGRNINVASHSSRHAHKTLTFMPNHFQNTAPASASLHSTQTPIKPSADAGADAEADVGLFG